MSRKRIRLTVRGVVQGVGFRPFLNRLALSCEVSGWARNSSNGVEAELSGEEEALASFQKKLKTEAPPFAVIEEIQVSSLPDSMDSGSMKLGDTKLEDTKSEDTKSDSRKAGQGFVILESEEAEGATLAAPDLAMCPECEKELLTASDRRYRYPFINCTNCGPRYTIIKKLPYDRASTVMRDFVMCPDCRREYQDIRSRRYHAQPDCCPDCGPTLFYLDRNGWKKEGNPIALAQKELARGGIVAIKGIGGIHLACDGKNEDAVRLLRERKSRPEKPLALLGHSLDTVKQIAVFTEAERELLCSPARPIVLLRKHHSDALSLLSKGERIGVMLPYSPIHHLLTDGRFGGPELLVMTSANRSGCPVLIKEDEAVSELSETADGYLLHNRPIQNRCDDSVLMEWKGRPYFLRRSRGYAPLPLSAKEDGTGIYAFGAEQKGSFALGSGTHIFLSPYIGDLKNLETAEHYRETLHTYETLFHLSPRLLVCDLHPDYLSVREAEHMLAEHPETELLRVQHHWAHLVSCMEDNGLTEPVFGIIWDGTGLGTDRTIWGGEFLEGDAGGFQRLGSIRPIRLPGGDRAVKEIGRTALSLLLDAGISLEEIGTSGAVTLPEQKKRALAALLVSDLPSSCPQASSIGRLFDGMASLLFQKSEVSYDGESGMLVESAAGKDEAAQTDSYPLEFYWEQEENTKKMLRIFDTRPVVSAVWNALLQEPKSSISRISRQFMNTLCEMAVEQCRYLNQKKLPVVLSGGVFQNRFLLAGVTERLEREGFAVYTHSRVSSGDEGLSLGQLAIGRRFQKEKKYVSCTSYENKNN